MSVHKVGNNHSVFDLTVSQVYVQNDFTVSVDNVGGKRRKCDVSLLNLARETNRIDKGFARQ